MCALTSRPSRRRLKAGSRGCLNKGLRANMWADADRISWHCQVRSACVCSAIFELPLSSLWTASSVTQKKLNNEPYSRFRSDAQVPAFFLEYTNLANATSSVFPVCLGAHCFPESLVLYDWIFCVCDCLRHLWCFSRSTRVVHFVHKAWQQAAPECLHVLSFRTEKSWRQVCVYIK